MARRRRPCSVSAKPRSSDSSSLGDLPEPLGVGALVLAEPGRHLDRGPDVAPAAGGGAQQPERVGGDAAGRRGERSQQRLVVEGVGDRRQQRADVGDLLLGPVAAAADDVGAQPGALQRVLVGVEPGEGAQQHDHRAAVHPLVGQLAQAHGQEPRLGQLVRRGARVGGGLEPDLVLVPALAGGQQHLDRRPLARRRGALRRGADPQGAEVVAQQALAERVDGADHLRPRAEVAAQRDRLAAGARLDRAAPLAEDVEVGVPEAVDRLQLVADDHQLRRGPAQRFDQPQLQAVGVLELVDEQVAEPGPVGGSRPRSARAASPRGSAGPRSRSPRAFP